MPRPQVAHSLVSLFTPLATSCFIVGFTIKPAAIINPHKVKSATVRYLASPMPFSTEDAGFAASSTVNGFEGQIYWPSATTGWIVQANPFGGGSIETTSDGGRDWKLWRSPHVYWTTSQLVNSTTLWAVGSGPYGLSIWHTSDRGRLWQRWRLNFPGASSVLSFIFPQSGYQDFGFIAGNTMWSSPTGHTWRATTLSLSNISVQSDSVDGDAPLLTKSPSGTLWIAGHTVSGAPAVVRIKSPRTASRAYPIGPKQGTIQAMDWLSAKKGWVVLTPDLSAPRPTQTLWGTRDGGFRWTQLSRWALPSSPLQSIKMTSVKSGWALSGQCPEVLGACGMTLWHTTNEAQTWTKASLPPVSYRYPDGFQSKLIGLMLANTEGSQTATVIDGLGPSVALYYSQRLWTDNGGRSWHFAPSNPREPQKP